MIRPHTLSALAALLGLGLFSVSSAFAVPTVTLTQETGTGTTGGGEFKATLNPSPNFADPTAYVNGVTSSGTGSAFTFQTFCIESQVEFSPGTAYSVTAKTIGEGPIDNNPDHPGNVPLDDHTAWLYAEFAAGTLDKYDYSTSSNSYFSSRSAAADALQIAIWYFQQQTKPYTNYEPLDSTLGQIFIQEAKDAFTANTAAATDIGKNVRALVLTSVNDPTVYAQDQLVIVPDVGRGGGSVPDGGFTVLLLGVGFGGLSLLARFFAPRCAPVAAVGLRRV